MKFSLRMIVSLLLSFALVTSASAQERLDESNPATQALATQEASQTDEGAGEANVMNGTQEPERKLQALPGEELYSEVMKNIPETDEIKPGSPMTLKEALLLADAQNLDLEAARIKLETAEAQLKQAWTMILPQISGKVTWAHLGKAPVAEIMGMQIPLSSADSVQASLTFATNLISVSSWYRVHMASEATKLTQLGIEQGRQALLSGVAQVYLAALLTGEVVKIQREQLNAALDRLDMANARLQAGVGVRLDVIQAEFNVENSRQSLIESIWSYETARDSLAGITNTEGLPVPVPVPLGAVENFSEEELINEALQQNRELQLTRGTLAIKEIQRKASLADFFPSVNAAWVGTYSLTKPAGMGSTDRLSWTLALNLNIPIFDYSKFGALDEQKAAMKESELELKRIELSTKLAVRKAKREYFSAVLAVDNAKRQVDLAAEAVALSDAAYKNGAATFLNLTEAQRNYNSASIAYVTRTIQAQLSFITLKSALGRDVMTFVFE